MDKRMKRFGFIALLILTVFCSQSAWALLTSSYYDGWTLYGPDEESGTTDEGLEGYISFAIYDTDDEVSGTELLANKIDDSLIPGDDRYIYAYQITQYGSTTVGLDITGFSVLNFEGNPLDESLINNTSAQDDEFGGIEPSPNPSDTQGVWTWALEDGNGYISAGEHSWLLVFSSNQTYTEGKYKIEGSGFSVPTQAHAPEPTTIAILALGSVMLTMRNRKRSRV